MNRFPHVPPSLPKHPAGRPHAFTLIELLVVIAIIAVLASLLLPVYNSVTASSKATKCLSNLRQIYVAGGSYSADHNGFIFPCFDPGDALPDSANNWTGQLAPYLGHPSSTDAYASVFKSSADLPVAVCPLRPNCFGYGYNYNYLSYVQSSDRRVRFSQVAHPAETVLMCDAYNPTDPTNGFTNWRSYVRPPSGWQQTGDHIPCFGHNGKANVLWVDGHATAETNAGHTQGNNVQAGATWLDGSDNYWSDLGNLPGYGG